MVTSAAVSTVSLSTSAADANKTVLPAGTTSAGEVIEAMPTSIRHGSSAIVDTTEAIAVPTDGPVSVTGSDTGAVQPTQVSTDDAQASSVVAPGDSSDAAGPGATEVQTNGPAGTGNTAPQATDATGIAPSLIDGQPEATGPTDAKDPMVTSIGSAQPSAV